MDKEAKEEYRNSVALLIIVTGLIAAWGVAEQVIYPPKMVISRHQDKVQQIITMADIKTLLQHQF